MKQFLSRKLTWAIIVGIIGVFVAWNSLTAAPPDSGSMLGKPLTPGLGAVRKEDLRQQITVAGTIVPFRRTVFNPPYPGYIKKIFVKLGQELKVGDPVVSVVQSLAPGVSQEVYPLRASFPGRVVQVLRQEGEYVDPGKENSSIVRVDDTSKLFIQSDVPESDIEKLKSGQEVLIKTSALLDRTYNGVIRDIALAAKERKEYSRMGERVEFDVRMEITDKDARVRPGMSAVVDIITARRDQALTLPHEFILKEGPNYFVTMENGEKRKIQVGLQNEEAFEVVAGLKENDRVKIVDFASLPQEM